MSLAAVVPSRWRMAAVVRRQARLINGKGWDTSETRAPIPQQGAGKPIAELAKRHSGKVALLFNGASLADHDLWKVYDAGVPIIGMNRTFVGNKGYKGPQPDYWCFVDFAWLPAARAMTGAVVINGSSHPGAHGYRVNRCKRMRPFSLDLARDGYVDPIPCTTGHLALQVAAYLGFTELYCLGMDMGGGHFDGTRASAHLIDANAYHKKQAGILQRAGVHAYVCGSPQSKCTAFPHRPFEDVLA